MTVLKKNIWTIFIVISLINILGLALFSLFRWQNIEQTYDTKQISLVNLVANATHSMLTEHEMILDILGSELTKPPFDSREITHHPLLDKMMALNPAIIGFGLATPEGKLIRVSSNMPLTQLPNLLQQAESKPSFQQALESDRMVLGRSYLMPTLNEWVIPIRKAVRDKSGNTIAVMTAGLRLKGVSSLFSSPLYIDDDNAISLVKDHSYYILYRSRGKNVPALDFNQPVPIEQVQETYQQLEAQHGMSIKEVKKKQLTLPFKTHKGHYGIIRYDNTYRLWIVSLFQHSKIHQAFIINVLYYLVAFLMMQSVLYWLFRVIHISEREKSQALLHQAMHDSLTGLPNRNYLLRWEAQRFKQHEASSPFSLLYIDMDRFKHLNDSFGHQLGDQALKVITQRLQNAAPEPVELIRHGGDEFLLIIDHIDKATLSKIAAQISAELSEPYNLNPVHFDLGCSIGIACYPEHGKSLDDLLRGADIAMYEAKKHRNSIRFFAESMLQDYQHRMNIEKQIQYGLDHNEFFMVYQPQIDREGQLYGVEALIRWQNQTLGFVPPDQFIAIAESTGLMPRVGQFVLTTAMREIQALRVSTGYPFNLSINISVKQFMQAGFLESLENAIKHTGIDRLSIALEITESLFIDDIDYILPLLQQVRDMGMEISMDDFGTGYSSLSMLASLPIDELKIDKGFVDHIIEDPAAKKMIKNIIAIGKNYNMAVLAEGVETEAQANVLKSFGCDRFQGYYFAKPLSIEGLEHYLESYKERDGG